MPEEPSLPACNPADIAAPCRNWFGLEKQLRAMHDDIGETRKLASRCVLSQERMGVEVGHLRDTVDQLDRHVVHGNGDRSLLQRTARVEELLTYTHEKTESNGEKLDRLTDKVQDIDLHGTHHVRQQEIRDARKVEGRRGAISLWVGAAITLAAAAVEGFFGFFTGRK